MHAIWLGATRRHDSLNTRVDVLQLRKTLIGCEMLREIRVRVPNPLVKVPALSTRVATAANLRHLVSVFPALSLLPRLP
jgi:hypothetical protein